MSDPRESEAAGKIVTAMVGVHFSPEVAADLKRMIDAHTCIAPEPDPVTDECDKPPAGWWCSRERGHNGPCAARPTTGDSR